MGGGRALFDACMTKRHLKSSQWNIVYAVNKEFLDDVNEAKYSKTTLQTDIFKDTDFLTGTWMTIEIIA